MAGISLENRIERDNLVLFTEIIRSLDEFGSFREAYYCLSNNIMEIPLCEYCKKNKKKFISLRIGYKDYCSSCNKSNPDTLAKRRKTVMEKYGVDNVSKNKEVISKIGDSMEKKYGVRNAIHSELLNDKMKATMKERYGVEYALQSGSALDKFKKTSNEKFGTDHPMKNEKIKEKTRNTNNSKYNNNSYLATDENRDNLRTESVKTKQSDGRKITSIEKYSTEHSISSKEIRNKITKTVKEKYGVDHIFQDKATKDKIRNTFIERYGDFNPSMFSKKAKKSINEKLFLLKFGLESLEIDGREYDSYCPEINTIIEIDGEFFHPERLVDINYMQLDHAFNDVIKERVAITSGKKIIRVRNKVVGRLINQKDCKLSDVISSAYIPDRTITYPHIIMNKDYLLWMYAEKTKKYDRYINKLRKLYILLGGDGKPTLKHFMKDYYSISYEG